MCTAPPFNLTCEQARRLQGYLQTYRRTLLGSVLPSAERNTTLRVLQELQGKVVVVLNQRSEPLTLWMTSEEIATLKVMVRDLLTLLGQQPASPERHALLADLADLKVCLSRTF